MHPENLPHWLPQVQHLTYVPIKCCLKIFNINGEIGFQTFTYVHLAGIDLHTAPCTLVGSACWKSIAIA